MSAMKIPNGSLMNIAINDIYRLRRTAVRSAPTSVSYCKIIAYLFRIENPSASKKGAAFGDFRKSKYTAASAFLDSDSNAIG